MLNTKLKVLDLFSGIGGFSLGLERTGGFETVAFCEIEKFPQQVLKKHWPDVPIYEDVRSLDYEGTVDVITGGYPCQPFSVAGKRKGKEDDRHLWPSMFKLIQKHRPTWVIGENVAGHVNMGLDSVLIDLASEGYSARTFVIPAVALNAHHRRDRLWIVAHSDSTGQQQGDKEMEGISPKQSNGSSIQSKQTDPNTHNIRPPWCAKKQIPRVSHIQSKLVRSGETIGIMPNTSEPVICGITNGFPGRIHRLKALGNAVVPQIPEIIGNVILETYKC